MSAPDWDALVEAIDRWNVIAEEIGLPDDWRARGYDTPEYMASSDSIYRRGKEFYCYPGQTARNECKFTTTDVEALFRHVHSKQDGGAS